MEIEHREISIREIVSGYSDNGEGGVVGFGGKLNIRPAYQREFVYNDKQRDAVIDTIMRKLPLNTFYWVENEDGSFEVLDGQQRTISFCSFASTKNGMPTFECNILGNVKDFYHLLPSEEETFLDYKIGVYICKGSDIERLWWFNRINTGGVKLTEQEIRNANYTGAWLSDAKVFFSRNNCPAVKIGKDFVKGTAIQQEILETALKWKVGGNKDNIAKYMAEHQHDADAKELKDYFVRVVNWVTSTFGADRRNAGNHYRKEMLGIDWGLLYNEYGSKYYDAQYLEERVSQLMQDDEVTDKKGIYEYVLSGEDERLAKKLSKRQFSESDKRVAYERQGGICPTCGKWHDYSEMDADHEIPWWRGGKTIPENLVMKCRACNRGKGGKME